MNENLKNEITKVLNKFDNSIIIEVLKEHPYIIFEVDKPDSTILCLICQKKNINFENIEAFKKEIPAVSTIRNARQRVIEEAKKNNIIAQEFYELKRKDEIFKENYRKDKMKCKK